MPEADGRQREPSDEDLLFIIRRTGETTSIPLGRTIYAAVWAPGGDAVLFADRTKCLVRRELDEGRETVLMEGVGFFTRLAVAEALAAPTRRDR